MCHFRPHDSRKNKKRGCLVFLKASHTGAKIAPPSTFLLIPEQKDQSTTDHLGSLHGCSLPEHPTAMGWSVRGYQSAFFRTKSTRPGRSTTLSTILEDRVKFWLLRARGRRFSRSRLGDAARPFLFCLATSRRTRGGISQGRRQCQQVPKCSSERDLSKSSARAALDEALLGRVANLLYVGARCGLFHEGNGFARGNLCRGRRKEGELLVTVPPRSTGETRCERTKLESVMIDAAQILRGGGASLSACTCGSLRNGKQHRVARITSKRQSSSGGLSKKPGRVNRDERRGSFLKTPRVGPTSSDMTWKAAPPGRPAPPRQRNRNRTCAGKVAIRGREA